MDTTWVIYVATGWKGGDESSRRTQSAVGAYALTLLPAVNAVVLKDENGEGLTALYVTALDNLWNASISAVHVSLYAITIGAGVDFQLDPSDYKGELADFLEAGVTFQIADDPDADLPDGDFDLP